MSGLPALERVSEAELAVLETVSFAESRYEPPSLALDRVLSPSF
jgi:hypothetical protein